MRSLIARLIYGKQLTNRQFSPADTAPTSIWARLFPALASRVPLPIVPKKALQQYDTSPMDISKNSYSQYAVQILQDIADSHFVSFDFEFSGISHGSRDRATKPTLEQRYADDRLSVQEFTPLQIGLTVCKLNRGRYELIPYNFNISPLPQLRERQFTRKWGMHSGAISFLQRNGFDLGRALIYGVPYLSVQDEIQARAKMIADSKREDMELKPHDQALVQHVREAIAGWQAQPDEDKLDFVNIPDGAPPAGVNPELNSYQRRLVHQTVQNEFPGMKSNGMGHFVQITNPSHEQTESQKSLEEKQRERDLSRAVALRWIVDGIMGHNISRLPEEYLIAALPDPTDPIKNQEAMKQMLEDLQARLRDRRRVLVGHNCLTDLMFLYKMTIGDLPEDLKTFQEHLHDMFPAIVDTKHLAHCFSEKHGRRSLGEVEQDLRTETDIDIHLSSEYDRYVKEEYLHEAGYDSYITAVVAIKMAAKLQKEGGKKKDAERQEHELAQARKADPHDFGKADEFVTAPDCSEQPSETGSKDEQSVTNRLAGITSMLPASMLPAGMQLTGDSRSEATTVDTNTRPISPTPIVAVKTSTLEKSPNLNQEIAYLRSDNSASINGDDASSRSMYHRLEDSSTMPGDSSLSRTTSDNMEDDDENMNRLIAQGKMMPRWNEEGPFWEVYGNRLQANGTQEGVMKLR